ncbi:MAG TPA: DUF5818 domain-containing protein [Rhodothermales bacterium]|nr:DUF5818 domain-containing protein [Rhodothermales bacterium]
MVRVDSGGGGRTLLISPASGPPGTRVRLVGSGYEPNTLLDLGVGPVDSEYEIIASVRTGDEGKLDTTVAIRAPASDSTRYVFVVAGDQAQWKVISDPFTITSEPMSDKPGASVTVRGTLTDEGIECQAMRGDDGGLYTLTGDLGGFRTGDRVRVEGVVAEVSFCQQGTTINVSRIERI